MNEGHLEVCGSDEWAEVLRDHVVPWVLDGLDLGADVLEIGPGPGRTTDLVAPTVAALTAVELDPDLAAALADRFAGSNVTVVPGDAASLPFEADRFSAALSFTMLHHVPTPAAQDQVFAELERVVVPGGWVAGEDSLASDDLAAFHEGDTYNPMDPIALVGRLEAAGLVDVVVDTNDFALRFRGRVPGGRRTG